MTFNSMSIHGLGLPYVKGWSRRAWSSTIGEVKFRDVDISTGICIVVFQNNSNSMDVYAEFFKKGDDGKYVLMDESTLGNLVKGSIYEKNFSVVDGRPRIVGLFCSECNVGVGIDLLMSTNAWRFLTSRSNEFAVGIKYGAERVKDAETSTRLVALLTKVQKFIGEMDVAHDNRVRSFEHSIEWYKKMLSDMDKRRANLHQDALAANAVLRSYGVEVGVAVE